MKNGIKFFSFWLFVALTTVVFNSCIKAMTPSKTLCLTTA